MARGKRKAHQASSSVEDTHKEEKLLRSAGRKEPRDGQCSSLLP